jgi:hypothetical protein
MKNNGSIQLEIIKIEYNQYLKPKQAKVRYLTDFFGVFSGAINSHCKNTSP